MKWLAALLCLLNAGLFLWATGHGPGGLAPASAYPVVNADNMRLLEEVRGAGQSGEKGGIRCARIGPFVDSAVAALAAQKLEALSLSYTRRTVKAREIRAHRVYLGPFDSTSVVDAQRRRLQAGDVEDFYVKRDERGGSIISLGLFSQRSGAEVLAQKLGRLDIEVKIRPEDRTLQPSFWLEIEGPVATGELPPALTDARWGEKGAELRRYECP